MVLPDKDTYTLEELLSNLPMKDKEFCTKAGISKVTLYYLKHGTRNPYRSTVNQVLNALSEVYKRPLSWSNVTGIAYEERTAWNKGKPRKKAEQQEEKPEHE